MDGRSPDVVVAGPRGIFDLNAFHVSTSLAKFLKKEPFQITTDRACREVIEACARSRPGDSAPGSVPSLLKLTPDCTARVMSTVWSVGTAGGSSEEFMGLRSAGIYLQANPCFMK